MKKLTISILLISNITLAQNYAETQTQLAKRNINNFFNKIPSELLYRTTKSFNLTRFDQMVAIHKYRKNYPKRSYINSPFSIIRKSLAPLEKKDLFPFENQPNYFEDLIEYQYGFCSGLSHSLWKIEHLAFFDKHNNYGTKVPKDEEGKVKFYEKIFKNIFLLKPQVIPNFQNIREFGDTSFGYDILRKLVINEWVDNNLSLAGLEQLFKSLNYWMSPLEVESLYRKINFRLNELKYEPMVYASSFIGESRVLGIFSNQIHVLRVKKIIKEKNHIIIRFLDTNFSEIINARKYMKIHRFTGKITTDLEGASYNFIDLYPNHDHEVAKIIDNKSKWCLKDLKHQKICFFNYLQNDYE